MHPDPVVRGERAEGIPPIDDMIECAASAERLCLLKAQGFARRPELPSHFSQRGPESNVDVVGVVSFMVSNF